MMAFRWAAPTADTKVDTKAASTVLSSAAGREMTWAVKMVAQKAVHSVDKWAAATVSRMAAAKAAPVATEGGDAK